MASQAAVHTAVTASGRSQVPPQPASCIVTAGCRAPGFSQLSGSSNRLLIGGQQGIVQRSGILSASRQVQLHGLARDETASLSDFVGLGDANADEAEVTNLQQENERLRQAVAEKLASLDEAQRSAFSQQHEDLRQQARQAGLVIPAVGGAEEAEEPVAAQSDQSSCPSDAPAAVEPDNVAAFVGGSEPPEQHQEKVLAQDQSPLPEQPRDMSAAVSEDLPPVNATAAQELSSTPESAVEEAPQEEESASGTDGWRNWFTHDGARVSEEPDGTVLFSFDGATGGLKKGGAHAARISPVETDADSPTAAPAEEAGSAEAVDAGAADVAAVSAGDNGRAGSPLEHQGDQTVIYEQDIDAAQLTADRDAWLYFVHPELPKAGGQATLFFNKNVSDILRDRPKVQVQCKFNKWELESPAGAYFDLTPTGAPHNNWADWWSVNIPVAQDAYELNYVFSDGEGLTDNNSGQDYLTLVEGHMTPELWLEGAPDRAAEAIQARREAERIAAQKAEAERQEWLAGQDLQTARWRAGEVLGGYEELREGSVTRMQHGEGADAQTVWTTEPQVVVPGQTMRLVYNNKAGTLGFLEYPEGQYPTLRIGHNNWQGVQEISMRRYTGTAKGQGDWWAAEYDVPDTAVVLNFVLQYWEHFDNNYGFDHKIAVGLPPGIESVAAWEAQLVERFRREEAERRKVAEDNEARKAARRLTMRKAAEEKVRAVRRRQMKHVLFTDPADIRTDTTIQLYYNPRNTPLNGREKVYVRGGWNRWTHPKSFGPIEMTVPEPGGEHHKADIQVPSNAYKMDFVFSDVPEGEGTYDNLGGFDYHLPVEGSVLTEPALHVVHIAVEMAPICKVGGLGDVVTALGRAMKDQGHLVEVILPRYDFFLQSPLLGGTIYETEFDWGGTHIYVSSCTVEGLRCFFIEPQNGFFSTPSVYGRNDDEMRFDFFCKAALEFLLQSGRQPDVLHCHDWSTASVARTYWNDYHTNGLWKPKVVFTIHNMEYGKAKIGEAAFFSQRFTTVSPTYAFEIGGEPAIAAHTAKFRGIRNGIDPDLWDPENDQFLPRAYNAETVEEGKRAAREALRSRLGLTGWGDKPIIGVVSRLTAQKGIHLIKHAAWRALERGGQFVLLGSAPDPKVQADFNALAGSLTGENAAFYYAYDEPLSHLIYAGCDIILVPSMFEPCGLTQLIAMRYGSVPVVRSTGGLHDTVFDVDTDKQRAAWEMEGSSDWQRDQLDETNGFSFEGTDGGALEYALNRALDAYYNDRPWFNSLQARVMRQDWSWNRPALDYIELYYAAMKI